MPASTLHFGSEQPHALEPVKASIWHSQNTVQPPTTPVQVSPIRSSQDSPESCET